MLPLLKLARHGRWERWQVTWSEVPAANSLHPEVTRATAGSHLDSNLHPQLSKGQRLTCQNPQQNRSFVIFICKVMQAIKNNKTHVSEKDLKKHEKGRTDWEGGVPTMWQRPHKLLSCTFIIFRLTKIIIYTVGSMHCGETQRPCREMPPVGPQLASQIRAMFCGMQRTRFSFWHTVLLVRYQTALTRFDFTGHELKLDSKQPNRVYICKSLENRRFVKVSVFFRFSSLLWTQMTSWSRENETLLQFMS